MDQDGPNRASQVSYMGVQHTTLHHPGVEGQPHHQDHTYPVPESLLKTLSVWLSEVWGLLWISVVTVMIGILVGFMWPEGFRSWY